MIYKTALNLVGFLFTLLFSINAYATNLCDASCDFIITFPDGGSLEAVEALTITFGTGGLLNLGATGTVNTNPQPANLDFTAGGSLILAKGESITFGNDGLMILGVGGNVAYTDLILNSSGGASLTAVSGTESIFIEKIVINGGLNITFYAKIISNAGTLEVNSGGTLSLAVDTGSITPSYCSISDSSATLTLSGGTIDTTDTCTNIATTLTLSPAIITTGTVDPSAILITGGSIVITPIVGSVGPLQLTPFTQEVVSSLPDGTELTTEDGNTCTVTAGECVSTVGAKYVVADGKLVVLADNSNSSGLLNLTGLLALFFILVTFRLSRTERRY